jgi:hypothetical protein
MENQFVSYDIAKELKELGFNERCLCSRYHDKKEKLYSGSPQHKNDIYTPTYQQAFEWFENEHSIFVDRITTTTPNEIIDHRFALKSWRFSPILIGEFIDVREGQIACLNKLIEIIYEK